MIYLFTAFCYPDGIGTVPDQHENRISFDLSKRDPEEGVDPQDTFICGALSTDG